VKIDSTDRKILYYLDLDARRSFSDIAKKVRLSIDAVQYRVKNMEKEGVIKGYYAVIDPSALGFMSGRFFLKFHSVTSKREQEIIDYFVSDPDYWWVDSIDGFRDLGVACWIADTNQFAAKKAELQARFGSGVQITQESIYSAFYLYSRAYLADLKEDLVEPVVLCKAKSRPIDELDWKILRFIANNARASSLEMAKAMKVTPATVLNRLHKMEKEEVIRRYRPMIDLQKLGYYWYKIEFRLKDQTVKPKMLAFFKSHPNAVYAYEAIGGADLELELEVSSYEQLREALNDIKTKFGESIDTIEHMLWYKEHKITYVPKRRPEE
jgi:DNA-binding Lrp family transcriptional regulator